ncbi:hypothetical protein E8E13_000238 [Curvularia kusanoi]|uniref:Protein-serine/threonine kinase n=1 Tax=Curvularia kusanoi TaxID=90978 RepID=A0A9P4TKQ9_CURKU|nr:hypothetical protein E8E13_000238 [Curvularia kusanoi]
MLRWSSQSLIFPTLEHRSFQSNADLSEKPEGMRWAHAAAVAPKWKPSTALDEWVQREARPISLRQLTFFGRTLTESRLMDSANYCRLELPTRLAHRLRDIQTLPYVVVANPHLAHVYESYLQAFERFRRVPEIRSVEDNDRYCKILEETLKEHATVIPRLAIGVLEVRNLMKSDELDKFMNTMLRARISRRVIAEQHLALSETYNSPWHFPNAQAPHDQEAVGEIFLRCNAKEIVESCGKTTQELIKQAYGEHVEIPEIKIYGHLEATFPYILSHLEYIIGELLRNSIQAVVEQRKSKDAKPPPIEVLICETSQHVIIRISDQGGGIPNDLLPYLWSFSKGPRREKRLQNLARVPKLLGTLQELQVGDKSASELQQKNSTMSHHGELHQGSLASLTSRPPDLRLGVGLPMSRLYAEYWAGSLEIHSLEGFGVDAFLQISKLGNKNERLTTRMQANVGASYKAVSHARPLPTLPSAQVFKEQRLRALISQQPITVHLHGLPFKRAPTVADVLMPTVRRSVFNENGTYLFISLQDEALTRLRENLIEDFLQSEEVLDEVFLVPCILQCLRSKRHRLIDVSFVNLIDSMLSMFHEGCSDDMAAANSMGWGSHSPGGLSRFLDNFLRAQDCFVGGQYLEVDFDFQYSQSSLRATGEVNWQSLDIRFLPLPERLSSGEEHRITPFMPRDSLGTQQVRYSIMRSPLNFHWDPEKQCFAAIVPHYADLTSEQEEQHVAETVLAATVTTPFPGDVKFERECRWSMRLEISPAENSHEPSMSAMETELQELLRKASWNVDRYSNARPVYNEPAQPVSPPSPQKRRGFEQEPISRAFAPKRRRYSRADQAKGDPLVYLHGGISIPTSQVSNGNTTDGSISAQQRLDPGHACLHTSATAISMHKPATTDPKTQAPRPSLVTDDDTLLQQQIISNYREFAGRKALREARLAGPVSDGERSCFEGVFLQDGDGYWDGTWDGDEVWSPVTAEEGGASAGEFDSGMGDA